MHVLPDVFPGISNPPAIIQELHNRIKNTFMQRMLLVALITRIMTNLQHMLNIWECEVFGAEETRSLDSST
jgi:hypothetical protein